MSNLSEDEGQNFRFLLVLLKKLNDSSLEVETMLTTRNLSERELRILFELMIHPDVFPFVRQKATTFKEFVALNEQMIQDEKNGILISRVILDEFNNPIGTINLFDVNNQNGFLGTWLGKPYHGQGYNALAKQAFLRELFYDEQIRTVFMRIRCDNIRSRKAAEKLPYIIKANEIRPILFHQLNQQGYIYDLYEIPKDLFLQYDMMEIAPA